MSSRFHLHGDMIPRAVKRMFDQRAEARTVGAVAQKAALLLRGRNHVVPIINLSPSGVMLRFSGTAHIGETVSVQLLDRGPIAGQVRWLRDGRMGVHFVRPLE